MWLANMLSIEFAQASVTRILNIVVVLLVRDDDERTPPSS
jgi:hypothetical protein